MYQHPGVYVEHIPSGLLAIEMASTSVAAIVGYVGRGDAGVPEFITSVSRYADLFGPLGGGAGGIRDLGQVPDAFGHAVNAFFANGGNKAYIVPLVDKDHTGTAAIAAVTDPSDPGKAFNFTASSAGKWANGLFIRLTQIDYDHPAFGYALALGIYDAQGKFRVLEQFNGVKPDPASADYLLHKVNGISNYLDVAHDAVTPVGAGAKGNGLKSAPLGALDLSAGIAGKKLKIQINENTQYDVTFDATSKSLEIVADFIQATVRAAAADDPGKKFVCRVTSDRRLMMISGQRDPAKIGVKVTEGDARTLLGLDPTAFAGTPAAAAPLALVGKKIKVKLGADADKDVAFHPVNPAAPPDPADPPDNTLALAAARIKLAVNDPDFKVDILADNSLRLSMAKGEKAVQVTGGDDDALTALGLKGDGQPTLRPVSIDYPPSLQDNAATKKKAGESEFLGGVDAGMPKKADYEAALEKLRDYRDVSIILLPGRLWKTDADIIQTALAHAEFMQNRMVIVDPPNPATGGELRTPKTVSDLGLDQSSYAALYYPWVTAVNPFYDPDTAPQNPRTFDLAPSAFAAGLWARIDGARGVWKAPAGLEATVRGGQGPNILIGNDYQDNLNEFGVNCIRPVVGPPVIWGARTLATKAKPEFRYVPVRRTQSMIGESMYRALQAVVFEPNDHRLWASLRASATDFMDGLFRSGAFQGEKASDAYFVRCGLGSTMTQGDIDAGIVRLVIGFAPLKPAEFVVVQIQQIVGQKA